MRKIVLLLLIVSVLAKISDAQISLTFNISDPTCYMYYDGAINMTISGGTSPYSVTWFTGGGLFSTQEDISNLTDGEYIVQVIDSAGLTILDTVQLAALYQILTVDTIANALCYSALGSINITPYNGNGYYMGIIYPLKWDAYLQSWYIDSALIDTQYTNIDTMSFVWAQPAGDYYIIVADGSGSGCYIEKYIQIHEPSAPLTLHKTFEHNICKGDSTGWINVVPSGGTPPYYYNWSNGVITAYNGALIAGTYTVGVRDINGCLAIESTDIYEPFREVILIPDTHDVSCRDNQDGYAAITGIENGFAPYLYTWSTGATENYISDLDSGYYSVTVTDANNCTATETYHIGMIDCGCITIYNVITPDGNGKNDTWIIKNIHLYPDADVQVFNRWGKLVFTASGGYDNSWDGTSEGKELDSGDYYYVVILNMGDYPPYTGPVKILK